MSYFEAATAGYYLTPYQRRALQRFFRDAEDTRITRDDFGYHITIRELTYPTEYSLEDAVEELQGLLLRRQLPDRPPLGVVVVASGDNSWVADMDHAVFEARYSLESI